MKKIKLTQGKYAIVDDENYELLSTHKWMVRKTKHGWYAGRSITNKDKTLYKGRQRILQMHRVIMNLEDGDKRFVDHINHNTLDNRKKNLRVISKRQNDQHKKNKRKMSSKYVGVTKMGNGWVAKIVINKKAVYLGYFTYEIDAGIAYDNSLVEIGFPRINFP